ncbi:hypothetical protein [Chryseobacterium sp. ON_d1]|uniref:hypothetical protein n=1 Tax=Chryseobacterium sp. ON_d1 TaxID=2583211 RepID=UPI0011576A49|nr:hypothetical protein [Chryseobacterium sp. ON_d1]GEJ47598.1 hypothetical protein CRS_42060 [Chryseobacterium sp. ON_d1]
MSPEEINKKLLQKMKDDKKTELAQNSVLIDQFIAHCKTLGINISLSNIDYIQSIGIIAEFPDLVRLLNHDMVPDKEGLINTKTLEAQFSKKQFEGYYYGSNFMVMANHLFRRGYSKNANFAPEFLDFFWKLEQPSNDTYIAIDPDRVRINVDSRMYMEYDTWYGAKFKKSIHEISDGVVKLRPPAELTDFYLDFLFAGSYSLDILWYSTIENINDIQKKIKVFQSEEFKTDNHFLWIDKEKYYPVRYVHAEFDVQENHFRHFDGAIHFYTEEEYIQRRDSDLNFNNKNNFKLKTQSQKLFKINGSVSIDDWISLTSQFMSQNPLVNEYFEGELPQKVTEILSALKKEEEDL